MAKKKTTAEAARERLAQTAQHATAEVQATEPEAHRATQTRIVDVPVVAVAANLRNVRQEVGDVSELAASIAEVGFLQALVVRPIATTEREDYPPDAKYAVLVGHRRLAAAVLAAMSTVPVVVRTDLDERERQAMLIENLQRQDLSPLEEARAFAEILEDGSMSQRALARGIGVTQAHVSRRLALLQMDSTLQGWVESGRLGVDVAVAVASKLDAEGQRELAVRLASQISPIDPGQVSSRVVREEAEGVTRRRVHAARAEQARTQAEKAGARIVTNLNSVAKEITEEEEIAAAADAGTLTAFVHTDYGAATYYDDRPAAPSGDQPVGVTAAPSAPAAVTTASEETLWKRMQAATAVWVADRLQPPRKTELAEVFAEHLVAMLHAETGQRVWKWLNPDAKGSDHEAYFAWLRGLTATDQMQVAWLATIARDMEQTRIGATVAADRALTRARDAGYSERLGNPLTESLAEALDTDGGEQ